jgi:integrase
VHLKVSDIDSARMLVRVEQGKGRKDRYVMLAPDLLDLLRAWWREAKPRGWLFPGRDPAQPITTRQLNRACHAAAATAALDKRVGHGCLRCDRPPVEGEEAKGRRHQAAASGPTRSGAGRA